MHVRKTNIRVLGSLWIVIALIFGVSFPFVASMSCAQITSPACADQRWSILHFFGGSIFWMQNMILALAAGVALIALRFRHLIVILGAYFVLAAVAIVMLMIHASEIFPFNTILFSSSLLILALGIVTIYVALKRKTRMMFKHNGSTSNRNLYL